MDPATWLTFFAASWAISFSIGPGAVAAMSAGMNHGFARGYFLTLGLILGFLTQLVVVSVGLGALVLASGLAFQAVKWAGVAYLLGLGVSQWRSPVVPAPPAAREQPSGTPRRRLIRRGWIINALNPKGTVFMLAVVPQFLDPAHALLPQYATIAATLLFTDLVVMAIYTALAARVLSAMGSPVHRRWLNRLFGAVLVLMATLLAAFKRVH